MILSLSLVDSVTASNLFLMFVPSFHIYDFDGCLMAVYIHV